MLSVLHYRRLRVLTMLLVFVGIGRVAAEPGRENPWCLRGTFKDQGSPASRYPVSADGKRLLCVGQDGQAHVYDTATGARLFSLKDPGGPIRYASYLPDGKRFITVTFAFGKLPYGPARGPMTKPAQIAKRDGGTRLWDADGKPVALLVDAFHDAREQQTHLSADGNRLLVVEYGTLRLWDVKRRELILVAAGIDGRLSPDGRRLLAITWRSDEQGEFYAHTVWDLSSLAKVCAQRFHVSTESVWSPDGRVAAMMFPGNYSMPNGEITIWDTETGQVLHVIRDVLAAHEARMFSPDGKFLVAWTPQQKPPIILHVFETRTGKEIRSFALPFPVSKALFLADSKRLLVDNYGSEGRILDAQTGRVLHTLTDGHAAVSPDARWAIGRHNLENLESNSLCPLPVKWPLRPGKFWFSPDGKRVVVNDPMEEPFRAGLWDLQAGRQVAVLDSAEPIRDVVFSSDSKVLATNGPTTLWDARTGVKLYSVQVSPLLQNMWFSPDSHWIFDGQRLWDAKDGSVKVALREGSVSNPLLYTSDDIKAVSAAFSRDGKHLFALPQQVQGSFGPSVWDTGTGKRQRTLEIDCTSCDWSADGRVLVTIKDRKVRVWDVPTGKLLHALPELGMWDAHSSADGRWIATAVPGSAEGKGPGTLVWDTRSGAQAAEIRCTSLFWLYAIEFSADGRWLLTTTSDGRALFWQLPGGRLLWSLRTHWQPQWAYLSADARILVTRNPEEAQLWVMTAPGERDR